MKSGQSVWANRIPQENILMTRLIRYPFHDLSEERSMGAAHTAGISVLADLDRL